VIERVIIGGFGGQGVLFLGKLLAETMMAEGMSVTYFPAYGPEVRGGRANCHIMIRDREILCPVITEPDTLIMMNQITWDYFLPKLRPDGLAIVNSSMVADDNEAVSQRLVRVPATDIAKELGDVRATNMVMLGAYNHERKLLPLEALFDHLRAALPGSKAALFDINREAVRRGAHAAAAQ